MSRPTFFHGIVVAALLGFFASAVIATLTPFVGLGAVVRIVIPGLGLAYLLILLTRSEERTGRLTIVTLWVAMTLATWWVAPPIIPYLLIHVGAIWLIRSLYFYAGIMPALMDLGLCGLSVTATVWSLTRSSSVFLATWCFFLVQALFVAIPPSVQRRKAPHAGTEVPNEKFELAKRRADAALRQLITQQ